MILSLLNAASLKCFSVNISFRPTQCTLCIWAVDCICRALASIVLVKGKDDFYEHLFTMKEEGLLGHFLPEDFEFKTFGAGH